jgi:type IV secretory pathway VirB10-like protein
MKILGMAILCVWACVVAAPVLAIGFDPRGAQEAAGLSREFDDATRLQQLQEAPELPPPPLVTVPKPSPPPEQASGTNNDPSALLHSGQQMSGEQAKRALQQADRQLQRQKQGGFWHTAWRFALWSTVGMAMAWAVWNWMVRRASAGLRGL